MRMILGVNTKMAFENLASRLADTFKKLRGKGKLSEKDIDETLREVRLALLEADVNFKVVKEFTAVVKDRCLSSDVLESLMPAQQVIKIVNEELIELLGGKTHTLNVSGPPPCVIALYGLQGSGKTSTAGKLGVHLKKQGRRALLVSCDIYRPAAQKQLELLAEGAGVGFFTLTDGTSPEMIAKRGVEKAIESSFDVVILDTAGRLQVDADMMEEARRISEATSPKERLLVVDAMSGQEACKVAEVFDQVVDITGVVLSKMDSDARGGAALSIAKVTGKPIKFVSVGEKIEDFEVFHPDRMASRILGMGDILTLIERAESAFDEKKAAEMEAKLKRREFTLEDFMDQMTEVKKMGSLGDIMRMIPGFPKAAADVEVDPKEIARVEAIIGSMTPIERRKPDIIDGSRKRRIAKGSGTSVQEVNRLLKQFFQARKMLFKMNKPDRIGKLRLP